MTGSRVIRGVPGSPGIGLGRAYVLRATEDEAAPPAAATATDAAAEQARWQAARDRVRGALTQLAERVRETAGPAEAEIFEAQAMMATDPDFEQQVQSAIGQGQPAEQATRQAVDTFAAMFAGIEDEYLRQRADDVREVGQAFLHVLAGREPVPLADLPAGSVLCAADLAAGALVSLDRSALAGLALGSGGATSHVAILARTFGVPAVLGLGDFLDALSGGDLVAVDGATGEVTVAPQGDDLRAIERAVETQAAERSEIAALVGVPGVTSDGTRIDLWANVGGLADLKPALEAGAEGVGLFRTEFLVVGRETLPTEDEQYGIYRRALETMGGRPVVFRTFDIGGDKPAPALNLPVEANPFLGYRAIRIELDWPDLLRTQLRAIVRAAEGGLPAWIMLPMVSALDEVVRARAVFDEVRGSEANVPLGIMIEVPSAALIAPTLARAVDFFSIGTNDLVQYTLAADRTNQRVADRYQTFHPAVLRLIGMAARAAAEAGIPCGVCGEMGGDPRATALLLGLGVTELSMSPGALGYVKREVRSTPLADARVLAERAITLGTADEVLASVEAFRAEMRAGPRPA